jgi:hypothetical protein
MSSLEPLPEPAALDRPSFPVLVDDNVGISTIVVAKQPYVSREPDKDLGLCEARLLLFGACLRFLPIAAGAFLMIFPRGHVPPFIPENIHGFCRIVAHAALP